MRGARKNFVVQRFTEEKLVGEESPAQISLSPQACHALREGAVIVYVPVCLAVAMGVQCA